MSKYFHSLHKIYLAIILTRQCYILGWQDQPKHHSVIIKFTVHVLLVQNQTASPVPSKVMFRCAVAHFSSVLIIDKIIITTYQYIRKMLHHPGAILSE